MAFEWTDDRGRRLKIDAMGILVVREPGTEGWQIGEDADAYSGLDVAADVIEVYRTALEPYAREFSRQRRQGREFIAVDIGFEVDSPDGEAIAAACRLMGITLPGDEQKGDGG